MVNMLDDGATWQAGQAKDHAGTEVVYTRGVNTVTVTATRAPRSHQVVNEMYGSIEIRKDVWYFTAADLILSSTQIEPQPGDTITHSSKVYEVLPALPETPCWDPVDAAGTIIAVYTVRVS